MDVYEMQGKQKLTSLEQIFNYYTERTPGSFIENKDVSIVWVRQPRDWNRDNMSMYAKPWFKMQYYGTADHPQFG